MLGDEGLVNGILRRRGDPLPQHAVGGDRRPRLRLPRVHDPADLRGARPHGPGADRGRARTSTEALADVPQRDAGRTRSRACSPAPVLVFLPAVGDFVAASAARRPGRVHGRQPDPAAVPRRGQLAVRGRADRGDDGLPAGLDGALPALAARGGRRGGACRPRGEALRPPALPARSSTAAVLRLPVRADRAGGAVLVQLEQVAPELRGLQHLRWYEQFFETESLRDSLVASIQIALDHDGGGHGARDAARLRARARAGALESEPQRPDARAARDARDRGRRVGAAAVHPGRAPALAHHDRARAHHLLDLVRDGGGARAARGARPRGGGRGDGPRRHAAGRRSGSITLPALWPAMVAAGLLVFALSFDDFVLSFFTTGESPQPLPVRIWSAIRFGVTPTINAIGTFMLVISASTIGLAMRCRACSAGARAGSRCCSGGRAHERDPLRGRDQALRRGGGRGRPRTSRSRAASSSRCSARRAAGRRRRCAWSPASSSRARAASSSRASRWRRCRPTGAT